MAIAWWGRMPGGKGRMPIGGGRRGRFFEPGEVRLAILSLLSEADKHGYQLMKDMQDRSGGTYTASPGSIYPTLQQLEDEGLVESEKIQGRRVYHLTVAGHTDVEKDPGAVRELWDRAESWQQQSQEMGEPFGALMKSAFRAARWASGRPEREAKYLKEIARACRGFNSLILTK